MGSELQATFERYRQNFKTKTHDSSAHGWTVLKGYLLLEGKRTYKNIAQKVNGPEADGQKIQQFMSDSPWSWEGVFQQVHRDINADSRLAGGTLNIDESGDECSGTHKAGASRQYIGRQGKVELGQVGVLGSYSKDGAWLLAGAELYLPEKWSSDEALRSRWKRLKIPQEREFMTKLDLARGLFDKAMASKLAFDWVGGDTFYGRDIHLRRYISDQGRRYLMSVPKDEQVWLGEPFDTENQSLVQSVAAIAACAGFEKIAVRDAERGMLVHEHAFVPVWSVNKCDPVGQRQARQEMLVLRKEADGSTSYALSNALEAGKEELARQRAERYFVERTIQDCKSELGWDELQALKYPAYMHTLAICSVALVFMAKVKLDQRKHYADPEEVQRAFGFETLPDLSLAVVKELMRSVMPLPRLSREEARQKVVQTLFDRSKSKASRVKKKKEDHKQIE
jgi:hypothetical protein